MGDELFQQSKDTEFQRQAFYRPNDGRLRTRIGTSASSWTAPELREWPASSSVLLPARLALFEERGVTLAGGRQLIGLHEAFDFVLQVSAKLGAEVPVDQSRHSLD